MAADSNLVAVALGFRHNLAAVALVVVLAAVDMQEPFEVLVVLVVAAVRYSTVVVALAADIRLVAVALVVVRLALALVN